MTTGRGLRHVAVFAVVPLVLLLAVMAIQYGVRFHTVAFWELPPGISYCDRDYASHDAPAQSREQIEAASAALPSGDPLPLERIGSTIPLVGRTMWARLTPEQQRVGLDIPCTMVIYLQTGDDEFVPYGLRGGP